MGSNDDFQTLIEDVQAEHLSFPLQAPTKSSTSNSELIAKFKVLLLAFPGLCNAYHQSVADHRTRDFH